MAERSRAVEKGDFYEKDTFFITVPVISNIMLIMISSYIQAIKKRLPIIGSPFCHRLESNQRHTDFQSGALPTELLRRDVW